MIRPLRLISSILPFAVAAAIWLPLAAHYYVPVARIPESAVESFVSRPADATLDVLAEQFLGERVPKPTGLPADSPEERLRRAGLFELGMDLDRFAQTGDARELEAIAAAVIEFSQSANGALSYDEFLWNDHAIANRIFVLAKFWRHYRGHPLFDPEAAREVLAHVARNVRFLLRDDHFTYWTNHGVMQSIALLHAANAFPALPDRDRMVDVALARLHEQLRFFVSGSGWIMEHSAGYQEFGANLLATLLTELELLGEEPPPDWLAKAGQARRVLEWLARPDGSLPNFGDSDKVLADPRAVAVACDRDGARLWPEGYFIAWDAAGGSGEPSCAQTAVVWSSFVSNAHKRPNELSVHYWVDGLDFVLSSGYWPYADPDRAEAIGWRGSNAPHLRGERDAYSVHSRGACLAEELRFVDLERRNESTGSSVRRQVVDMGLNGVLLIDSSDAPAGVPRDSAWRIDPRVRLVAPDGRTLQGDAHGAAPTIQVSGAAASVSTLAELYADEGHAEPAKFGTLAARERLPAYVVTSPSAEPTLIALTTREPQRAYRFRSFESPERWVIEDEAALAAVERDGPVVALAGAPGAAVQSCEIAPGAGAGEELRAMESSFLELADRYPIFKPWTLYRAKATLVVLALFLAQLVAFALLRTAAGRKLRRHADGALVAGWVAVGGYLVFIYLGQ